MRAWTLNGKIQSHVDVYADDDTFDECTKCFNYIFSPETATGSGAVAGIVRRRFAEDPFDLFGITVTPFKVNHGFKKGSNGQRETYTSLGFAFDHALVCIPDFCSIPISSMQLLERSSFDLAIFGCLRLSPHPSLASLPQIIALTNVLNVRRVRLSTLAHGLSHEAWTEICMALQDTKAIARAVACGSTGPTWKSWADWQVPDGRLDGELKTQGLVHQLHELLEIDGSDHPRIVELALSEILRHDPAGTTGLERKEGEPLIRPVRDVLPAFDGLVEMML